MRYLGYSALLTLSPAMALAVPILPCGLESFGGQTRAFNGAPLADRTIYVVTSTDGSNTLTSGERELDDGGTIAVYEGTLRGALMHNRLTPEGDGKLIIFETSGTITHNDTYYIPTNYLTIAGQTAPPPGITIRGTYLRFSGHDVLVQHLRVRNGDWIPTQFPRHTPAFRRCLTVSDYSVTNAIPYNVVIDHCSFSWGIDQTTGAGGSFEDTVAHDITFNKCIVSEGLHNSLHEKAHHAAGALFGDLEDSLIYGTLWAHNNFRQPATGAPGEFAIVNNLFYNPGDFNTLFRSPGILRVSYVGNRVIGGNNSGVCGDTLPCIGRYVNVDSEFFIDDNQSDAGVQTGPDDWSLVRNWSTGYTDVELQGHVKVLAAPVWPAGLVALPVGEVRDMVAAEAGARPAEREGPHEDPVDGRIIDDVLSGGSDGRIIDCTSPGTLYWPVGNIASADSTTFTLEQFPTGSLLSEDDAENDRYNGMTIEITSGNGAGQTRVISDWDAPTLTGTVPAWSPVPEDGSEYRIHVDCSRNAGGYPTVPENPATHVLPADPHGDADGDGYTNLEEWLHDFAFQVEGTSCSPVTVCGEGAIMTECLCGGSAHASGYCCTDVWQAESCTPAGTVFSGVDPWLGDAANWTPLTPSRWEVTADASDLRYFLNTSEYDALPGGRLGEYTLVSDRTWGDFTMTLLARSAEDLGNGGADYAVLFGFQDADNYYYMMFNQVPGNNELFRVVAGTREAIGSVSQALVANNAYHAIELARDGDLITLAVDGSSLLSVSDDTFGAGAVGVGSFNDSAYFDDILVTTAATTDGAPAPGDSAGGDGDPPDGDDDRSGGDPAVTGEVRGGCDCATTNPFGATLMLVAPLLGWRRRRSKKPSDGSI